MRKAINAAVLLAIIFSLVGCSDLADYVLWRTYSSKKHRFSIMFPREWDMQEQETKTALIVTIPRPKGKREPLRSNFTMTITDLPQDIPLTTYFEANHEELTGIMPGATDFEEGQVFKNFLRGMWLSFNSDIDGNKVKIISVVWIKNNKAYVLTFITTLEKYSKLQPVFRKIMNSMNVR